MEIVTGKTGKPHVTSEQFRQIMEGIIDNGSYILKSGEQLEPELVSNNLLKIRSGAMSHHGNISVVKLGGYDEVTINNGTQGMKRIDLVVNRYSRNAETNNEENDLVVIQGTPAQTNPVVPNYTSGNMQDGDLVDDCPVFEVHLDGINVVEVKKLLPVILTNAELNGKLPRMESYSKSNIEIPANGTVDVTFKFDKPFSSSPVVCATKSNSSYDYSLTMNAVNNGDCTVTLHNNTSAKMSGRTCKIIVIGA